MEDMLMVAVCEDDPAEADRLQKLLAAAPVQNRCTVFHRAEELLEAYRPLDFDLIFMDIYMDGISGVDAVTRLRQVDGDVPVAFTTSSPEFALESYRLSALQYIEKPVQQERVDQVLYAAREIRRASRCLSIRRDGKEERIRLSRIVYLESQNRRLKIVLQDGSTISCYEKLSAVLPQLENRPFFSCHKSYCVNLDQVSYIDQELSCFRMSSGENIPIRRGMMPQAKQLLREHLALLAKGGTP